MKYRFIGHKNNPNKIRVSTYGLGTMRFPVTDETQKELSPNIDEPKAIKMIRYALDSGVNYIDTAYPYHAKQSEIVVGKALQDGYRKKAVLATKLPMWLLEKEDDVDRLFQEQLSRLQTDYFDLYLLHALNVDFWERTKKFNVLEKLEKYKKQGKIKAICFSFHDELSLFKTIVDSFEWDMAQIQLNIIDENYQAGIEGLNYASERGISVVAMEPLRGGKLLNLPEKSKKLFEMVNKDFLPQEKLTPQELAFKYLYSLEKISSVLSGASDLDQLKQSIAIFSNAEPNSITPQEMELAKQIKKNFDELTLVSCTACNYCLPCPQNINIPAIFTKYNNANMFDLFEQTKVEYDAFASNATDCIDCKKCESACPQQISIVKELVNAHNALA